MKREILTATAVSTFALAYSTSVYAQVYDWSGVYVGGLIGYGTHGSRTVVFRPIGVPSADLSFASEVPTFNRASPAAGFSTGPFSNLPFTTLGANGLMVGGTLGYNRQFDRIVLGLETDFAYFHTSSARGAYQQDITVNGSRATTTFASVGTDWLSTLRGRVGYAYDRLLIFGTGGLAFGQTHLSGAFGINENNLGFTPLFAGAPAGKGTTVSTSAVGNAFGSRDSVRTGYVVGGGAEYALTDHLTIKLEGLYYDLGTARTTLGGVGSFQRTSVTNPFFGAVTTATSGGAFSIQPLTIRYRFDGALARVGLNYKF